MEPIGGPGRPVSVAAWGAVMLAILLVVPGSGGPARAAPNDPRAGTEELLGPRNVADIEDNCVEVVADQRTADEGDDFRYVSCEGKIATFFDPSTSREDPPLLGLDTQIALPEGATGPLPTVLLLHTIGGGRALWDYRAFNGDGTQRSTNHFNVAWFVKQGYAVINYTARGFDTLAGGSSCGPRDPDPNCATKRGWTHFAERSFEVEDAKRVLGLAVDAGIADPGRLAAGGHSYGAIQTWLLATELPWDTPAAGERRIQLAGAVPAWGATDMLQSLAPNGRGSDRPGQEASHERPFGVLKKSLFDFLHLTRGDRRNNTQDPGELHSFIDGWSATFNKGEPYDTPDAQGNAEELAEVLRGKSAFYAEKFFAGLRSGTVPAVPVFAIQGWRDPLFPAVETLQMYRRLKAVDPGYPIWMAFGDTGHLQGNNPQILGWENASQLLEINNRATQFLNAFVRDKAPETAPPQRVISFKTSCPHIPNAPREAVQPVPPDEAAQNWDKLTRKSTTLSADLSGGPQTTTSTSSSPQQAEEEAASDAFRGKCIVRGAAAPGPARWTWQLPPGTTLLGLPEVKVDYALDGLVHDATVVGKLWDVSVAADGAETRTLVTRGVYRLTGAGSGILSFQLFGNHWTFEPGHFVELQLAQTDVPFFRPDNFPTTITFSSPQLVLPQPG